MNISVCLATYNGAKFIKQQLASILIQLGKDDEVVILDDCSKDNTLDLVGSFNDSRIKIYNNKINMGHVYTFGKVIELSTNEIIFMSDQDDVWLEGRVEIMKNHLLKSNCMLISSNSGFIDSNNNIIKYFMGVVKSENSKMYFSNIIDIFLGKNYFGCAMAFRKELKEFILPIPSYVESHDLWIAMAANILGSNVHIDEITFNRRIHSSNASIIKRKMYLKVWSRVIFLRSMFHLFSRNLLTNIQIIK